MKEHGTRRYLRWFEKIGDDYIADEDLIGLELDELQSLFNVPIDNPMYDCWKVNEEHVLILQKHVKHNITIEEYDYFVGASSK